MRNPRDYSRPLAVGAPAPRETIADDPTRMLHFFDPSDPRMVGKLEGLAAEVDVLVGNLEDAIAPDRKQAAREGLVGVATELDLGGAQLWTRVNSLDSPWVLDDMCRLIPAIGARLDVVLVPKVESPEDMQFVDRLLAQLEARARLERPVLVNALVETARGIACIEEICAATPRLQGVTLGPGDLAADRRMKTTRLGGGHPDYLVREDASAGRATEERTSFAQDLWHYTLARMVDACVANGVRAYSGPFGDIEDVTGCEDQFRNARLLGCVGALTLHPVQIPIARRVFTR